MPLLIEDGTGVTGADSFVTVAECSAFAVSWFGASLTGSPTDKEAALRRAFGYMRSLQWCNSTFWPAFGGTIPDAVKEAQMIFARAEFLAVNSLQPSVTRGQQKVLNRVGSIGWQITGTAGIDAQRQTVTMATDRLKGLLCGNGSVTFLDRA
jgi:hypothetical protein